MKLGMGRSVRTCSRVICRGHFGGEKATEVWSFDFGLRVGFTAIEAQQKMQVSQSGYAITSAL